jgi:hypothetical protein
MKDKRGNCQIDFEEFETGMTWESDEGLDCYAKYKWDGYELWINKKDYKVAWFRGDLYVQIGVQHRFWIYSRGDRLNAWCKVYEIFKNSLYTFEEKG